jgi:hypothetical protein
MIMRALCGTAIAFALAIVGCSSSTTSSNGGNVSCDIGSDAGGLHVCLEYLAIPGGSDLSSLNSSCSQAGGTILSSGCAHAGTGGGCELVAGTDAGTDISIITWGYTSNTTAQTMASCMQSGETYVAP